MKRVILITGSVLLFVCRVNAQVPSEKDGKYSLQITTNNNGVKMHIDTTFNDLESQRGTNWKIQVFSKWIISVHHLPFVCHPQREK